MATRPGRAKPNRPPDDIPRWIIHWRALTPAILDLLAASVDLPPGDWVAQAQTPEFPIVLADAGRDAQGRTINRLRVLDLLNSVLYNRGAALLPTIVAGKIVAVAAMGRDQYEARVGQAGTGPMLPDAPVDAPLPSGPPKPEPPGPGKPPGDAPRPGKPPDDAPKPARAALPAAAPVPPLSPMPPPPGGPAPPVPDWVVGLLKAEMSRRTWAVKFTGFPEISETQLLGDALRATRRLWLRHGPAVATSSALRMIAANHAAATVRPEPAGVP